MARRNNLEQTLYDLGRALGGSRAPSRRTLARYAMGGSLVASPGVLGLIKQALNMLGVSGSRLRSRRRGFDKVTQGAQALAEMLAPTGAPPRRPGSRTPAAPAPEPPEWTGGRFSGRFPGSTLDYGAEPPRPGEASPFGEEILTPQSSNVFSFSYSRTPGQATGTLYVTFKANALNTKALSTGHARKGKRLSRRQLKGQLGATVSGKTNDRGPQYAYMRVPPAVFTKMRAATSKGKFVWDALRIRGTIYGHRYNYVLVQGSVTLQEGMSGVYIPRKATSAGFRTRSVRDIGSKTFQTSTLPQSGFANRTKRR